VNATARTLIHAAAAIALCAALGGCATRYDSQGNPIYRWQWGQDNQRDIDYSNPRLPILPPANRSFQLWPIPSPYDFNDLSRYSFLDAPAPLPLTSLLVGDNAACAACSDSNARLALLAVRADARDGRRASAER